MRYARTLAWDERRAEDLVHDTVVRALERSGSFDGRSSLATWLHRILHNLAVDQARRRRELPADLDEPAGEQVDRLWADDRYTVNVAVVTERSESREQVQDALLRLPLIYRSAVALHDMEGLTVAEIAEVQAINLSAAKQRLRRGRMMLVSELAAPTSPPQTPELPLRCWDARSRVSDYMDDDLAESRPAAARTTPPGVPHVPPALRGARRRTRGSRVATRHRRGGAGRARRADPRAAAALARGVGSGRSRSIGSWLSGRPARLTSAHGADTRLVLRHLHLGPARRAVRRVAHGADHARPAVTSGCGPSGSGTTPTSRCSCCTVVPGASDELYECFDTWFPGAGIEYYYYDQLGSFRSDQPDDPSLWDLPRFVDEVEQVRARAEPRRAATSCCSGSPGAACSRWSTPCTTRRTSRAWSSRT